MLGRESKDTRYELTTSQQLTGLKLPRDRSRLLECIVAFVKLFT